MVLTQRYCASTIVQLEYLAFTMEKSQWYSVAIASIAASFLIVYLLRILVYSIRRFTTYYFLKYLYYRRVYTRVRGPTWFCTLLIVIFVAGNTVYIYIQRKQMLQQTAVLSIINIIPLAFGGHANFLVDSCGINVEDHNQLHRWIGRVAVTEALLHSILAIKLRAPNFQSATQWAAIVVRRRAHQSDSLLTTYQVASAMAFLIITSLSFFRRHLYETFVRLHQILSAVIMVGIWMHVPGNPKTSPTIYLLIASCIWLGFRLIRIATIVLRNFHRGTHRCRAVIWSLPDAVQVHVIVSRPWKYRAGQYLYLCVLGSRYSTWVQSHPYFVSWWYKNEEGQDVVVLIISRQRGFSASLTDDSSGDLILGMKETRDESPRLRLATDVSSGHGTKKDVFIEGPYGQETQLGEYGTVLLFATGIGISGLLPFIKQFLQGFHNWEVKARRIALFWEVESEREYIANFE